MFDKLNIKPLAMDILLHLSRSPGREFYLREVSRVTGGSLGGCHNSLKELRELGLVISRKSGRNLYFKVNDANPAIRHFKIFMNILELNALANSLSQISTKLVLFGSCATGDDTNDSDTDIMIVTDEPGKARELCNAFRAPRKVQAIIFTPAQLLISRDKDPAFHAEIDKGIVLHKSQDERV